MSDCSKGIFTSVIITSQHLTSIPPVARTNSDYMCAGQLNKAGLDFLCDEYIAAGLTKDQFCQDIQE
jgi:hypothetical protein